MGFTVISHVLCISKYFVDMQDDDQLQSLREIRNIMDRSTRFQSLSGLSGIVVGLVALAGAGAVQWYLSVQGMQYAELSRSNLSFTTALYLGVVATVVLMLAAGAAMYFTILQAQKNRKPVWNTQARRLLANICLPLAVGGVFCGALLYHSLGYLVAPATLLFYGLALINGSKYTFVDLHSLGVGEVFLGLVSCFLIDYGLLAWTIGFGLLHIVYGTMMYYKYDSKERGEA